jgi:high-affinity iron transporter
VLGSFLIFLREGIEGSMICAILLTCLAADNRRDLFRWVLGGAALAVVGSLGAGAVMYLAIKGGFIGSQAQTWFETGTFGLAVVILTYMTFWMKRHARGMAGDLRARAQAAVAGGSALALGLVAFVTVGRESVETAIFLLAIAFQSSPLDLVIGALAGLAAALAASFGVYRLGLKLNLRRFFTAVGAALMVVAAGLLANMIQNLQALAVIPGGGHPIWDTSRFLPSEAGGAPLHGAPDLASNVGDVLHGLIGYTASPTALQVLVWLAFLSVGLWAFLRSPRPRAERTAA